MNFAIASIHRSLVLTICVCKNRNFSRCSINQVQRNRLQRWIIFYQTEPYQNWKSVITVRKLMAHKQFSKFLLVSSVSYLLKMQIPYEISDQVHEELYLEYRTTHILNTHSRPSCKTMELILPWFWMAKMRPWRFWPITFFMQIRWNPFQNHFRAEAKDVHLVLKRTCEVHYEGSYNLRKFGYFGLKTRQN